MVNGRTNAYAGQKFDLTTSHYEKDIHLGTVIQQHVSIPRGTQKNSHFFYTIFMLESPSGLNFFLAVEKVLGGSLALGRLLRLFTQLGMDLRAPPGSAINFHSR
jgi:hypothetical protein